VKRLGPIYGSADRAHGFVRIGNWYGVGYSDHRLLPPLYSERNRPGKLAHYWHIGPWCLRLFVPQLPPTSATGGIG
jgi:hypothetical protein